MENKRREITVRQAVDTLRRRLPRDAIKIGSDKIEIDLRSVDLKKFGLNEPLKQWRDNFESSLPTNTDDHLPDLLRRRDSQVSFEVVKDPSRREWGEVFEVSSKYIANEEELDLKNILRWKPVHYNRKRRMRIQTNPFDMGSMRFVFLMEDMDEKKRYVGKLHKDLRLSDGEHWRKKCENEMITQTFAKKSAIEFNRDMKRVGLKGSVIYPSSEVVQVDIGKYENLPINIEPYLPQEQYTKYNGNFGFVPEGGPHIHPIPQAFSHYSFQKSRGFMLVCNIEGILLGNDESSNAEYLLTDPSINSHYDMVHEMIFEPNFGRDGFTKFFLSHTCNDYCKKLGLKMPKRRKRKNKLTSESEKKKNLEEKKEVDEEQVLDSEISSLLERIREEGLDIDGV